jgi:hypothetical protein
MINGQMRGDILVLEIDCSAEARAKAPDSKSGKTKLVASTHGFQKFGDISVSLNATIAKAENGG